MSHCPSRLRVRGLADRRQRVREVDRGVLPVVGPQGGRAVGPPRPRPRPPAAGPELAAELLDLRLKEGLRGESNLVGAPCVDLLQDTKLVVRGYM